MAEKSADSKSTAVAAKAASGAMALPDDMMSELNEHAGAGTSSATDDNIVPFISLLQDMSPEQKKRDPGYVDGAEAGFFLNKATRRLWGPNDVLAFVPCAFTRSINQWTPRDAGGGFRGRFPLEGTPEDTMRKLGGEEKPDPRDSSGRKKVWKLPNGDDLIDTRYHFGFALTPDGRWSPAVMSFSSTGHTSSRQWMTLMNEVRVPDGKGGSAKAPSWFKAYRIKSTTKSNTQGEWFVINATHLTSEEAKLFEGLVNEDGWVISRELRSEGAELYKSVMSGKVGAASEEDIAASGNEADVPI